MATILLPTRSPTAASVKSGVEVFVSVPSGYGATVELFQQDSEGKPSSSEIVFFFVERALTAILAEASGRAGDGQLREDPNLASFGKLPLHLLALVNNTPESVAFGSVIEPGTAILEYVLEQNKNVDLQAVGTSSSESHRCSGDGGEPFTFLLTAIPVTEENCGLQR